MSQFILWMMLIVPWLSLLFLKKESVKRFLPPAILASLLVTIVFEIGYVLKWWVVVEQITAWDRITSVPLVYGAFFVGTLWIFHFTYDRPPWVYFLINALTDFAYAFIGLKFLVRIGIYRLVNMGSFGIYLMMLAIAIIIYLYERWLGVLPWRRAEVR